MRERQLNSTTHPISFLMVLASDHISPATGTTPTVLISKDGGAFAAPAGAVTEIGQGWYALAASATDRNTLGQFLLHATATGCDPTDRDYTIVGYDPFDAARLGLTSLPAAVPGTVGGVLIDGTNTGPLVISGGVTFSSATGDAFLCQSNGGNGKGINASGNGTGEGIRATGGATGGSGINAAGGATNSYGIIATGVGSGAGIRASGGATGQGAYFVGGTTSGQGILVTTTSGDGFAVTPTAGHALTLSANGTSKHGLFATGGTAGTSDGIHATAGTGGSDIAGNRTGNLTGSVGSVATTVPADVQTIKGQAITCPAAVTVGAFVGTANVLSVDSNGRIRIQPGTGIGQLNLTNGAVPLAAPDSLVARTGTCPAGSTATTIVLDAGASSTDDAYKGMKVRLIGGTGSSLYQTRTIIGYTGATQTATVDRAWKTTPDGTTTFALIYANAARLDAGLRVDVGSWLDQAVTLDAGNLPNVAVKDWNGVAVGALPANFSALAIDGSGNVSIVYEDVWTTAGAPTISGGVVAANIVQTLGTAATTAEFPTTAAIATAVITDVADMTSPPAGSLGARVNAAGAAGDPWGTPTGSYAAGTFGALVVANLNTPISTRSAPATPQTIDTTTPLVYRDQRTGTAHTSPDIMDALTGAHFASWGTEADQSDGTTNALAPDGTTVVFSYPAPAAVPMGQLPANGLDLIVVEAGVNARQALSPILAAAAGTLSGAGTGTIAIQGGNVNINRITATTDAQGNRSDVTLILPS